MRIRILAATAAFTAGLVAITGNSLAAASTNVASTMSVTTAQDNALATPAAVADYASMEYTAAPEVTALATKTTVAWAARVAPATTETMKAGNASALSSQSATVNTATTAAARAAPVSASQDNNVLTVDNVMNRDILLGVTTLVTPSHPDATTAEIGGAGIADVTVVMVQLDKKNRLMVASKSQPAATSKAGG